jgi:tRNA dimethylallyltransferase
MVGAGALGEVAALVARRLDPGLPAMQALGLAHFAAHLAGRLALDEALAAAQRDTRRYAKRQLTWFRNQTPDWPRWPV